MAHDSNNLGISSRSDLPIETLNKVQSTAPQLPAPAFISQAMVPEVGSGKGRVWVGGVSDEASGGVGIECEKKRNEKMMRIPEGLKRLLADLRMSGRVHEKHT